MLSEHTRRIVKQTVPILRENGEALTRHFYTRMFTHDPQVTAYFNPAHQHSGTQQKALAAAILTYAEHIDDPSALAGAIDLIAHKHVSLGIQPEHYPIVGKHLLGSISELLGDAATDDVISAWGEAYGLLADVCIAREAELYREHEANHGWVGFRDFVVERIVKECEIIRSFYLKPADGRPLAPFLAGQYITVRFARPDGQTTMRNYSLSGGSESFYRISVKREAAPDDDSPNGFVSHQLHESVQPGDRIEVGPPCGHFVLDSREPSDRPLVLLSGGVGITPLLAMLHEAEGTQPDRPVVFIQCARNRRSHAFHAEVQAIAAARENIRVHIRYSHPIDDEAPLQCDSIGVPDAALIRSLVSEPSDAEYYFCGPAPFMHAVHEALDAIGAPEASRHYEFFGPAQSLGRPAPAAVH